MPPLYESLFLFSSRQGYLAEIKRLDLPTYTPKDTMCKWLWIQETTVTALQFVDMTDEPVQAMVGAPDDAMFRLAVGASAPQRLCGTAGRF